MGGISDEKVIRWPTVSDHFTTAFNEIIQEIHVHFHVPRFFSHEVSTKFGNCYTFNSDNVRDAPYKVMRSGVGYGMAKLPALKP